LRHYPALAELDPDRLRQLGHLLSMTACRFAMELDEITAAN
jgi:hypothetical protein